jgi:hypothetical protein
MCISKVVLGPDARNDTVAFCVLGRLYRIVWGRDGAGTSRGTTRQKEGHTCTMGRKGGEDDQCGHGIS